MVQTKITQVTEDGKNIVRSSDILRLNYISYNIYINVAFGNATVCH